MDGKKYGLLLLLIMPRFTFSQSTFNADSVYHHIRFLAKVIGPRPVGSAAEHRALTWVVEKFRTYGADSAYVMPFTQVAGKKNRFNTNSGIAIGLFRGETDTAIVVGGHADSYPPESPGANDNASGTATAIELARLWSTRPRHYTMLFISFGGEEIGLYGSQYFVDHYKEIDKIGLMFSLDMTGGPGEIITIMENKAGQAPRWLVEDAFRLNRELRISPLRYPTHFGTINLLLEGAGSDHEPFLRSHIPAMDFSSGLNTSPIHAAQDNLTNIDKSQLDQCGRFIDTLLIHYQTHRLPARKLDHYTLWTPFAHLVFIPKWILVLGLILCLSFGLLAFRSSRRNRIIAEKSRRIRFSPIKLVFLFILVSGGAQIGEALIQAIKGLRYPWQMHVWPYLMLMLCWALAGLWLALRVSRRWQWNPEPHVYASRSLIILAGLTLLASFASARLAIYPGLSLLSFALAVLSRSATSKTILTLCAPLPMLRLIFSEVTEFFGRSLTNLGMLIDNIFKAALYTSFLTLALLGLFLPFIYSSTWLVLRVPWLKNLLQKFRTPLGAGCIGLLLIFVTYAAYRLPAYDAKWRPSARLDAEYQRPKGESELTLVGNEYFQAITIKSDSIEKQFTGRTHKEELAIPFTADWATLSGSETCKTGAQDTIAVQWLLQSRKPWYDVQLTVRVDTLEIKNVDAFLKHNHKKDKVTFSWRSLPPESLRVNATLVIPPTAKLIRELTATFLQPPVALTVFSPLATISYRTKVIVTDTIEVAQEQKPF